MSRVADIEKEVLIGNRERNHLGIDCKFLGKPPKPIAH